MRGVAADPERLGALLDSHRYHIALGSFACGLALADGSAAVVALAAAAGLALPAVARATAVGLLCATLVLAGALAGAARLDAIERPGVDLRPGAGVSARAQLLERPRSTRFGSRAELRLLTGPGEGARVLAQADRGLRWPDSGRVGSEILLRGRVRPPAERARARFDFAAYLRRGGVAAEVVVSAVRWTGRRRGGWQGVVDSIRGRAERALSAGLPPATAALLRGMVLGQDDLIEERIREDWRDSGLAHLLAVSGQNVMLLAALALPLLTAARLSAPARAAAVAGLVAVYVPLAGAGPSLQRAGVMGIVSLAALGLARPASRWYALLLAACATLALNPRVHGDPGWQLSFAAVVGILLLAPGLRTRMSKVLPGLLADAIAVTVAASLATAPLVAYTFGAVPLLGLPANVLAVPLVAPVMWLGVVRAGLGQLIPTVPLAQTANDLAGVALGPLVSALAALARTFADVPEGRLALPAFSPGILFAAYAVLALGAVGARWAARRAEGRLLEAAAAWRRRPRVHRVAAACAVALVPALLLARLLGPPGAPSALTVSFLDVGQGDATLVQHPDGTAILFDGGPPEARVARLLRAAGVRRLSAVVMTHASRDHHGGLMEVVQRYPVDTLVDGGDGTRDPDFRATVAEARRRGARRVRALAPLELRVGAVAIHVLSPPRRAPGPPPEDPNARAVVAVVSSEGFDLLLSADAESPTLGDLRLPRVEAMKVPHHGSADPGLPDVLRRLRPAVAAIQVGSNDYGHPAPSTLAALRAAGVLAHRTDRDGTVRVTVRRDGMHVKTKGRGNVVAWP